MCTIRVHGFDSWKLGTWVVCNSHCGTGFENDSWVLESAGLVTRGLSSGVPIAGVVMLRKFFKIRPL